MTDPPILGSYWTLAGNTNPGSSNPGREWSPWDVRARIRTASEVGFAGMGFWHADLAHIREEYSFDEVSDTLAEVGIDYVELEFVEYGMLDGDHVDHELRVEMLLEAAEILEADHLKIGNLADVAMDLQGIRDVVSEFADRAASTDTRLGLEFVTGDENIRSLEQAAAVVEDVDNAGVILDPWHIIKREIPLERVRSIPVADLTSVELNDGIHDLDVERGTETTNYRALPGEGDFDVEQFVTILKEMSYTGPWGVEVLSKELRTLPMEELYRRVYASTRDVIQQG